MRTTASSSALVSDLLESPPLTRRCLHCGDGCDQGSIETARGFFCCTGCEAVYTVLQANGLGGFYACPVPPGVSQQRRASLDASRFAVLDDPLVRPRFVQFDNGRTACALFSVPAMHCASCVWLLERLNRMRLGILRADVDLTRRTVRVTFEPGQIALSQIAAEMAGVGYEPLLDAEASAATDPRARRRLYTRLGVAGFAFGNAMLFSIPRYVNGAPLDGGFQRVFDVLNIALALPVLLYSASDYFRSAWAALRNRAISLDVPIALGLIAMFARSVWDITTGRGEGFLDSFSGLVFFLLIGRWFQLKAFDRIAFDRTFRSFFPLSVRVERDGRGSEVTPIERLQPGDRIVVRPGEIVPADAMLLDDGGRVDYAFLSGEAAPVDVLRGQLVRAGGRAADASLRLRVETKVSQSQLASLWNDPSFSARRPDWLADLSARFGRWFVLAVLAFAAAGAIIWWPDGAQALSVATAVLIIACPCALALAAPMTLGTAMTELGRRGLYLRSPAVALALSRVDTVIFDKTGTLTNAAVSRARPGEMTPGDWALVERLAVESTHPVSRAIAAGAAAAGPAWPVSALRETLGGGVRGIVDGHDVVLGSPTFVSHETGAYPFAASPGDVVAAIDGRVRAAIRLESAIRPGVAEAVGEIGQTHAVSLLSGDHETEAARWAPIFGDRMFFRQSPQAKLAEVAAHQRSGRHVLMIGDGLNDAGALGAADVGVAVSDDTASLVPACDAMLRGTSLSALPAFLRVARQARQVIFTCFLISIAYNAIGLALALGGMLTPLAAAILMPVSSLTVIAVAIGATRWIARRELFA